MDRTPPNRDLWIVWLAIAFPALFTLVYFVLLAGTASVWQQAAYGAGKLIQFLIPAFWVMLVNRERPRFRLPRIRDFAIGAGLGLALFAGLFVLYYALEPASFLNDLREEVRKKLDDLGVQSAPAFAALAIFYSLIHSGLEEYYWRWFVFGRLRRLGSFGAAVAISSLGFMAHHVVILGVFFGWSTGAGILITILASAAIAIGGAIWAWLYDRTGSLYAPWVSHAFIDAAIFAVGYDMIRPGP